MNHMGYLQEHGLRVTYRDMGDPKTVASLKSPDQYGQRLPKALILDFLEPALPKYSLLSQLLFIACVTLGRSLVDLLPF